MRRRGRGRKEGGGGRATQTCGDNPLVYLIHTFVYRSVDSFIYRFVHSLIHSLPSCLIDRSNGRFLSCRPQDLGVLQEQAASLDADFRVLNQVRAWRKEGRERGRDGGRGEGRSTHGLRPFTLSNPPHLLAPFFLWAAAGQEHEFPRTVDHGGGSQVGSDPSSPPSFPPSLFPTFPLSV